MYLLNIGSNVHDHLCGTKAYRKESQGMFRTYLEGPYNLLETPQQPHGAMENRLEEHSGNSLSI